MSSRNISILNKAAWIATLAVAIVFSIKHMREPDVWWMLRTGEWMMENGEVISTDVFSYTFGGNPWINIKWLFEVVCYNLSRIGGAESIFLLQMMVNISLVFLLSKITGILQKTKAESTALNWPTMLAILIGLVGFEYRMIGRPEMVSHLFSFIMIYLFVKHRSSGSKSIFWIIPLQVCWVNSHEAYGTGAVITVTMAIGFLFEYYITKTAREKFPKIALLASAGALLAMMINPRGWKLYAHMANIFSQVGDNKFTTELQSFTTNYYWNQNEPYLAAGIVIICMIALLWVPSYKGNLIQKTVHHFGAGYLALFFLFLYLGLTAHRNLVFFFLIATPLLAIFFDKLASALIKPANLAKANLIGSVLFISLCLCLYASVITDNYYKGLNKPDRFGLKIYHEKNPVGVTQFIRKHEIKGRCYSDFLISSYLLWELRPEFKTFIDLRDLDVFPPEFFKQQNRLIAFPQEFDAIDSTYQFDYAAIYRPQFAALHRYLFAHENWAMVYADPVAVLYIKRKLENQALIDQFEIGPEEDRFSSFATTPTNAVANAINKVVWPLYKESVDDQADVDLIASSFYNEMGWQKLALDRAIASSKNGIKPYESAYMMGLLYLQSGQQGNPQGFEEAQKAFSYGVKINPNKSNCYKGLAYYYFYNSNWKSAEREAIKGIEANNSDHELYLILAEIMNRLGSTNPSKSEEYNGKWLDYMEKVANLKPGDLQIKYRLGISYCQLNRCEDAAKYLKEVTGYPGISQEELNLLTNCKRRCL